MKEMAFDYEKEYKRNIREFVQNIKTTPEQKDTEWGKAIRELKKECLILVDTLKPFSIVYKPHVPGCLFFVTESRAGLNKAGLDHLEQLREVHAFLTHFIRVDNK